MSSDKDTLNISSCSFAFVVFMVYEIERENSLTEFFGTNLHTHRGGARIKIEHRIIPLMLGSFEKANNKNKTTITVLSVEILIFRMELRCMCLCAGQKKPLIKV